MDKLIFLKRDKRMLFSILAIVISSMLVVVITSLSNIAIDQLNAQMVSFGSNKLIILPFKLTGVSASAISHFSEKDLKRVVSLACVKSGYGAIATRTLPIEYKGKSFFALVVGSEDYMKDFQLYMPLKKGRYLRKAGEVIVGYRLFKDLDIDIGDTLSINNKSFKVVGILKEQETQTGSINTDTALFITIKDAHGLLGKIYYFLVVTSSCNLNKTRTQIEATLNKDITIISSEFFKEQLDNAMAAFTLGTLALGLISGIIASLGVINSMIASVIRRKKTIALMKVFGMTNKELFRMLLWEAGVLSLLGTVLGLILGLAVFFVVLGYLGWDGMPSSISIVGLLAIVIMGSIIPAWFGLREVKSIQPIEALRT